MSPETQPTRTSHTSFGNAGRGDERNFLIFRAFTIRRSPVGKASQQDHLIEIHRSRKLVGAPNRHNRQLGVGSGYDYIARIRHVSSEKAQTPLLVRVSPRGPGLG